METAFLSHLRGVPDDGDDGGQVEQPAEQRLRTARKGTAFAATAVNTHKGKAVSYQHEHVEVGAVDLPPDGEVKGLERVGGLGDHPEHHRGHPGHNQLHERVPGAKSDHYIALPKKWCSPV